MRMRDLGFVSIRLCSAGEYFMCDFQHHVLVSIRCPHSPRTVAESDSILEMLLASCIYVLSSRNKWTPFIQLLWSIFFFINCCLPVPLVDGQTEHATQHTTHCCLCLTIRLTISFAIQSLNKYICFGWKYATTKIDCQIELDAEREREQKTANRSGSIYTKGILAIGTVWELNMILVDVSIEFQNIESSPLCVGRQKSII